MNLGQLDGQLFICLVAHRSDELMWGYSAKGKIVIKVDC